MKKENYNFDIPEHWHKGDPELWTWTPEYLGVVGICIDRHEEWAGDDEAAMLFQRSGASTPSSIVKKPWHELDDDLIVECQSQVFAYNDVCLGEIGKLVLLNNGEVGKLRKAEFRLATDEERIFSYSAGMPLSFVICDIEVETDNKFYEKVMDYDIRFVDTERALLPSVEMRSLQVRLIRAIHRENNRIISFEDWKRKKGLLPTGKEVEDELGK